MRGIGSVSRIVMAALALLAAGRAAAAQQHPHSHHQHAVREVEIVVRNGYQPSEILATEGERIRLRFIRRDDADCAREVVFPGLKIRKQLPAGQPVIVELGPLPAGRYEFKCGMDMFRGAVVVRVRS